MGSNVNGALGQNSPDWSHYSSPVQIPGTTWSTEVGKISSGVNMAAIKTDGTMWSWGYNGSGEVGDNSRTQRSSPVQIPGTTWKWVNVGEYVTFATKTDGTMWAWGSNDRGQLGLNTSGNGTANAHRSSPTQIPGTTWESLATTPFGTGKLMFATRSDGTIWGWGYRGSGSLGTNESYPGNSGYYSSPIQIPGTEWVNDKAFGARFGLKTDGTLWSWGYNNEGELGQNNRTTYSSPVQIPGTTWINTSASGQYNKKTIGAIKRS